MDVLRELEKVFLVLHNFRSGKDAVTQSKKVYKPHKDTEAQRKNKNISRKDAKG